MRSLTQIPDFNKARPSGKVLSGAELASVCTIAWHSIGHTDVEVRNHGEHLVSNLINGLPPSYFKSPEARLMLAQAREEGDKRKAAKKVPSDREVVKAAALIEVAEAAAFKAKYG